MIEWTLLAPGIAAMAVGIGMLIFVRLRLNGRRRAVSMRERRGG